MNRQSKNEIIAEANIISHGEIITRRSFSKILKGAGIGLFLFVFSGFCSVALAQTGSISGTVADDNSGEIIQGEVKLLNSNTEAASSGGAFDFTGLAEGDYTLLVNSPGYYSRAIEINLSADEKIEQIIGLAGVSANEQRALNFSNTLSTERTNDFGDYSIKEALVRVPGIQVSREGEINIRGTGFDSYNVTLNGQRLANTGFENRSFDLASISVDAIRKLEVIKVLTPDMDADALGGVINLHTTQLAGKERKLSARLGGGANTQYLSRNGPGNRAWLNYSEKFQENISVALNLSYQEDQQGWEELNLSYGLADFGSGLVDVVEQISPSLHMDNRGRFGSTVSVSYDPAEEESYFFRAMVATDNRENVSHANNWLAQGDWVDQLTTGAEGELGTYSHDARQQSTDITQATFQAGGEHQLETLDISYSAGWSQSIVDRAEHLFPFEIGGFDYAIDWSDRARPSMTVTNRPTQIMEDGSVDRRFMIGQEFERTLEEHVNNEISARVDVNYPIGLGSLKAGVSTRLSIKDGEYDENFFTYNRTLRMVSFNMLREPNRNIDIIGNDYTIPWLVNTGDARSFFDNQRPVFSGDDNLNRSRSEIRNYHSSEHINAGYGMATFEFGKLSVIGGARLELAYAEYTGNQVTFDDGGDFIESNEVIDSGNDLRIFPNAQFIFDATENSSAKLAYTRTMARPNYIALTPFERVNHFDSTIFRGNPQLDPVTSDNLDLMLEYSFDNNAHISVGGFYKELSDFVFEREETVSGGEMDGYQERTFHNGSEKATIYGAEFSLWQRLSFLPGALSNIGTFANYTWSASDFETNRPKETAFPGQSPHVVNVALDYTGDRFFAQVSYHRSARFLSLIEQESQIAPSLNASGQVYLDRYQDGYEDLSATFRYTLSRYFMIWANVSNLLRNEQLEYAYDRQFYQTSTYVRDGLELKLGVRFDL